MLPLQDMQGSNENLAGQRCSCGLFSGPDQEKELRCALGHVHRYARDGTSSWKRYYDGAHRAAPFPSLKVSRCSIGPLPELKGGLALPLPKRGRPQCRRGPATRKRVADHRILCGREVRHATVYLELSAYPSYNFGRIHQSLRSTPAMAAGRGLSCAALWVRGTKPTRQGRPNSGL